MHEERSCPCSVWTPASGSRARPAARSRTSSSASGRPGTPTPRSPAGTSAPSRSRPPPGARRSPAPYLPAAERTPEQAGALALAATLADEIADAEALLFAVPLYNFGVSQHIKTYVDLVITDPRFGPRAEPPTAGKPAVLVTVRGGNYSAGTPREGWDHATGWLRRILADVWGMDLRVVERDFTLVGVNPALDSFTDLAAELKATAEREATEHGRLLSSTPAAA
ncbi:NAD(P)H-dependent oxidoreductase [Modestobacter marinus]|uniref:NAD(P)H-dependent oxidoreductase n=1 Tax=Modestobacter marinus TaxID=477641 RepID=UPI00201AEC36|nr:NAD(P)H-dependent oxidoreductase [Modestobacter marinus]